VAEKDYYVGSQGPFRYEATETYPDGKRHKGFRGRARLEGDADDAPVNIEATVAPTSPEDGDMWILTTGVYARVNGATLGPLIDASGGAGVFVKRDGTTPLTANWDAGSFQVRAETFRSDVATGTAPFTVDSTTVVGNLNVSQLLGSTWAAPPAIGSGTPAAGSFTTLGASGVLTAANASNAIRIGTACDLTTPPAIGGTTPAAGSFTAVVGTTGTWTGLQLVTISGFPAATIRRSSSSLGFGQGITINLLNSAAAYFEYAAIAGGIGSAAGNNTAGTEKGILSFYVGAAGTGATGRTVRATIDDTGILNLVSGAEYRVNATKIGLTSGAIAGVLVTAPAAGHLLLYDSVDSRFENVAASGDFTITSAGVATLKNTGTAGTYTSVTTDAQGRVTAGTNPATDTILSTNLTDAQNTGVGEDDLMSYTVPAGQLADAKDSIWFEMAFAFDSGANNKRVKIYFGATMIYDSLNAVSISGMMVARGRIWRNGATTQTAHVMVTATDHADRATITYPAETLSGTVVLKATGEATITAEIVQESMIVGFSNSP